ncbi:hypothetical protein BC835DRAFT_1307472 [Cytidiella melzeri]|nr:hypothetical protein BC835DRAFT_1307472 [Cytidiella melzeri]
MVVKSIKALMEEHTLPANRPLQALEQLLPSRFKHCTTDRRNAGSRLNEMMRSYQATKNMVIGGVSVKGGRSIDKQFNAYASETCTPNDQDILKYWEADIPEDTTDNDDSNLLAEALLSDAGVVDVLRVVAEHDPANNGNGADVNNEANWGNVKEAAGFGDDYWFNNKAKANESGFFLAEADNGLLRHAACRVLLEFVFSLGQSPLYCRLLVSSGHKICLAWTSVAATQIAGGRLLEN